jgi:tRNA(Ile2) C34 agmatinyltransferase TiaS
MNNNNPEEKKYKHVFEGTLKEGNEFLHDYFININEGRVVCINRNQHTPCNTCGHETESFNVKDQVKCERCQQTKKSN